MSMTINAPSAKVTTYDVVNQTAVQFNFEFDPSQFRADGTTLVLEYEGNEIRLENFFDADGATQVEDFLTQDGQAFSASEFLAAIMGGTEGGTAEDLETAAAGAAGGSGAGEYSDDPGNLFDGLDALGGQPDAYAQPVPEQLEELPGPNLEGDGGTPYQTDLYWDRYRDDDGQYWSERVEYKGKDNEGYVRDARVLYGHARTTHEYVGTDGSDTLFLPDEPIGAALRLEDDSEAPGGFETPNQPRVVGFEVIEGGSGDDVVDLSSTKWDYVDGDGNILDVTVNGNDGNDVIWGNSGADTLNGGSGDDNLIGGMGDDVLNGGIGNDVLKGSDGVDILNGGEGLDSIYGGRGDDIINGGADNDFINGQGGHDVINAGTGTWDVVRMGGGKDTLVIDGDSVTDGADADPLDFDGSTVQVLDFTKADSLQLDPTFQILDVRQLDVDLDGTQDIALFVGESNTTNNTWVVLSDADASNMSTDMMQMIIDAGFTLA